MNAVAVLLHVVATNPTEVDAERYKPGPVALGIVLLLGLVLVFLLFSLRKQVRRIDFDEQAVTDEERARSRRRDDDPR